MPQRSPLEYDISVTADKRRRARLRGMTGEVAGSTRDCEWPGCASRGAYRAPVSPDRLNDYRWFCLDHVRDYNRSWNFFADLTEDEIDAHARAAMTWERPTWSFRDGARQRNGQSPHAEGRAWARWGFADPLEVLGDNASRDAPTPAEARVKRFRRLTREEQVAMDTLGLDHGVEERGQVRSRYRALVKDLHPDMNGGNRREEARLGRVIRAWDILKNSRNFRDG